MSSLENELKLLQEKEWTEDEKKMVDSFIENLSDYLLHDFNFKYLKRADNALYNIIILNNN